MNFTRYIKESKQYQTIVKLLKKLKHTDGKYKYLYIGFVTFYLLNPFDLIPDFAAVVGLIDDLLVILWAAEYIRNNVPIDQFKQDIKHKIKQIKNKIKGVTRYGKN